MLGERDAEVAVQERADAVLVPLTVVVAQQALGDEVICFPAYGWRVMPTVKMVPERVGWGTHSQRRARASGGREP